MQEEGHDLAALTGRRLKQALRELLHQSALNESLSRISRLPPRQVVNPLVSFLYSTDPQLKWRAVAAMGEVVSVLSDTCPESARVIMRRLMWNLNDESGGIGWGSAEAMGEIMARSDPLASEYGNILISYIRPGGNFLEMAGLRHGALWGIGRVAHAHCERMIEAARFLPPFLTDVNPEARGLAAWAAGPLRSGINRAPLSALTEDAREIDVFIHGVLMKRKICELATEALSMLRPAPKSAAREKRG